VGLALGASKDERSDLRGRLASADGYTVFDRRIRRVGTFIELAGESGEEIAIRHDAVFLWRRRMLPVTTVATVFPERRAIVLNVDRRALKDTVAAPTPVDIKPAGTTAAAGETEDWQTRITRYVEPDESDTDAAAVDDGHERARASGESGGRAESVAAPYLLFVSTSRGYRLVERHGAAPATSDHIEIPEHEGVFRVAKLAISPLPHDRRVCAYLERIE
jgi:hypothetical protein